MVQFNLLYKQFAIMLTLDENESRGELEMDNVKVEDLIRQEYDNLSRGKQKVAKYILESLKAVSYSTITELKKEIGVSETTIIRFAHAIGFKSYSQMQEKIKESILDKDSYLLDEASTYENSELEDYKQTVQRDIDILKDLQKNLDIAALEKSANLITNAKKILVIGGHTAYASAYWFYSTVGLMVPNVHLVDIKNKHSALLDIDSDTVLVAISFPRYRKLTYTVAQRVKDKGGHLISISDSILSPISRIAEISLLTSTNRDESGYNSISPVISLLNLLIISIRKINETEVTTRLIELEKYYSEDDEVFE